MNSIWQEITLGGGIHAFVAGSGTPVILLPGWPETAEAYSEVFAQLADRHQLFALDPPGLGNLSQLPKAMTQQTSRRCCRLL